MTINKEIIQADMESHFRNKVRKDPKIYNAYLLVHSERHDIHLNVAEGSADNVSAHPQQPYFIASVGKLFTSVLVGILFEQQKLSYDDTIDMFLDDDLLQNLHVYKGRDYTKQIRIKHLLNHTSGLHDFFEEKPKCGLSMFEMIINEPSRFWNPREAVIWSKTNLKSHFPPGDGFYYTDTGYHILGLIIENVTSKPFHQALHEYIFQPLGMNNSWLNQYSEPIDKSEYPVAGLYYNDINIIGYRSLGIDYAGGGINATTEDLLKFMKALVQHRLIKKDTFERMKDWAGFFNMKFMGIDYGYGLMNFKTIPLVMPKKYNVWGNAGSTGSFMFYHPESECYFIGSLNQFRYHRKGIMLMFKMIDILFTE